MQCFFVPSQMYQPSLCLCKMKSMIKNMANSWTKNYFRASTFQYHQQAVGILHIIKVLFNVFLNFPWRYHNYNCKMSVVLLTL